MKHLHDFKKFQKVSEQIEVETPIEQPITDTSTIETEEVIVEEETTQE